MSLKFLMPRIEGRFARQQYHFGFCDSILVNQILPQTQVLNFLTTIDYEFGFVFMQEAVVSIWHDQVTLV